MSSKQALSELDEYRFDDSQAVGTRLSGKVSERLYRNSLEPLSLISTFLRHPPVGFKSHELGKEKVPAFSAPFFALTTLDESQVWLLEVVGKFGLEKYLTVPALFVGTTVSEYMLYSGFNDLAASIKSLRKQTAKTKSEVTILKDLPVQSPLLTEGENSLAEEIIEQCQSQDFLIVEGQALAFVPIDFSCTDEYLARCSYKRRKDFRRKLRKSDEVEILELSTGDKAFGNPGLLRHLYYLYVNVYQQSKIHFDRLTMGFFSDIFLNAQDGVVFIYRANGRIIGFNLCFCHGGNLVDKYVGFEYPAARDYNLYFLSWFHNLEYCLKNKLKFYIAGWTDPAVKAALGAKFTFTKHAVYIRNPLLRLAIKRMQALFESDHNWAVTRSEMEAS